MFLLFPALEFSSWQCWITEVAGLDTVDCHETYNMIIVTYKCATESVQPQLRSSGTVGYYRTQQPFHSMKQRQARSSHPGAGTCIRVTGTLSGPLFALFITCLVPAQGTILGILHNADAVVLVPEFSSSLCHLATLLHDRFIVSAARSNTLAAVMLTEGLVQVHHRLDSNQVSEPFSSYLWCMYHNLNASLWATCKHFARLAREGLGCCHQYNMQCGAT
jgi:hypothetical protein